jgi:hypothetical protein
MIDWLATLHEKAGRITITLLALVLLGVDMFAGKLDTGTLGIIVATYVGGAALVKTTQNVTVTRRRR